MSEPVQGTREPAPAARWEDAFLSGNGRHGAMVFGDPNDDRVIVNHHTLVRPNGSAEARPPALADQLPEIQDRLLAGDLTTGEEFTDGRPLLWVQPFHPAFRVRLRRAAAEWRSYRRAADFTTGVVSAECDGRRSEVFVSRADDVVVQYVTGPDLTVDVTLDHRLPGVPRELRVGHSAVLAADGALLTLRAGYPDSDLAYTGVTLAVVTGGRTRTALPGLRVDGARSLLLLTRVRRSTGEPDALAEARALRELLPDAEDDDAYAHLLTRHTALHRPAYLRATFALGADPTERALPASELVRRPKSPALLERLFAAGRYHLLSAAGMMPPRLTGLWTGDWDTAWSGAFTTDANLNLRTASAAAAALPEVTGAHAALIQGQLPHWRDNARAVFGTRGVVAPAHTDGESGHIYHLSREYPLHVWTAGADWLLKPLVDHDETRGERDARLTDALAEVAYSYEDFLTRTDDNGHVVNLPSYSPENRPANASWVTLNAAMDLSAARHALLTAADYHPGPDADRWRALADRLVLFPALPAACPSVNSGACGRGSARRSTSTGGRGGRGPSYAPPVVTVSTSGLPPAHARLTSSPGKTTSSHWGRGDFPLFPSSLHPWKGHRDSAPPANRGLPTRRLRSSPNRSLTGQKETTTRIGSPWQHAPAPSAGSPRPCWPPPSPSAPPSASPPPPPRRPSGTPASSTATPA